MTFKCEMLSFVCVRLIKFAIVPVRSWALWIRFQSVPHLYVFDLFSSLLCQNNTRKMVHTPALIVCSSHVLEQMELELEKSRTSCNEN